MEPPSGVVAPNPVTTMRVSGEDDMGGSFGGSRQVCRFALVSTL